MGTKSAKFYDDLKEIQKRKMLRFDIHMECFEEKNVGTY